MIDRARLSPELANRSPLSIDQLEMMIGELTSDKRRLIWDIITQPKPFQFQAYMLWAKVAASFPEAKVTGVKGK